MLSDRNRCQLRLSFPLALHTVVLALFTSTHALAQYKLSPSDSLTRCSPTDITVTSSQPPVELQIQAVFPNGDKTLVSTQQFNSDGFTYPFTPTFQVGFSIQISAKDGSGSTNTNYFRITNSAGIACGGDLPADPSSSARLTATDRSISTSDTSLPIPTRPSKPSPARPPAITSSGASSDTSASFETTLDSSSISPASSVLPSSSQPPALLSPSFDPTSHPDSTTPTSTSSASVASGSATSSRDPAPSSTATIRDDSTSNSHSVLALSKGGTAGIAIGCVVLAILAFLMCLRQKRRRPSTGESRTLSAWLRTLPLPASADTDRSPRSRRSHASSDSVLWLGATASVLFATSEKTHSSGLDAYSVDSSRYVECGSVASEPARASSQLLAHNFDDADCPHSGHAGYSPTAPRRAPRPGAPKLTVGIPTTRVSCTRAIQTTHVPTTTTCVISDATTSTKIATETIPSPRGYGGSTSSLGRFPLARAWSTWASTPKVAEDAGVSLAGGPIAREGDVMFVVDGAGLVARDRAKTSERSTTDWMSVSSCSTLPPPYPKAQTS